MDNNERTMTRTKAIAISLLAALPLLILKLIFLSDLQGWTTALGYGLFQIAILAFALFLLLYLGIETALHIRYLGRPCIIPAFSLIAVVALATFFFVGEWARPFVLQKPEWCRVVQVINFQNRQGHFVLVMIARGNLEEHQFVTGYLNWSGDEHAGLSSITLDPVAFEWWAKGERYAAEGSPDALRARLSPAGLPEERLELLTEEFWAVIQSASRGDELETSLGKKDPLAVMPFGNEHLVLGGAIWLASVTLLYLVVGQLTLTSLKRTE